MGQYLTCLRCSETDPAAFFPSVVRKAGPGARGVWCRRCAREYYRERVRDDPQYFLRFRRARGDRIRLTLAGIKAERGCLVCGEHEPACLDFHHRDPAHKHFQLGEASQGLIAVGRVMAEVLKCDVLCSNCHRKWHAGVIQLPLSDTSI